jgi:Uma2 family endonuclease
MASAQPEPYIRPDEYLTLERGAEFKSEYLNGVIYAMAGSSPEHSAITANVTIALGAALRGTPCQLFTSDLKVATSPTGLFAYPDLSLVCEEPRFHDEHRDVLTNPSVIIEVLSPSTEAYDRGRKFVQYQRLASLTDYLLIAQDEPRVEHFRRQEGGEWLYSKVEGLGSTLPVASLGVTLPLSEVYERIRFAAPPQSAHNEQS